MTIVDWCMEGMCPDDMHIITFLCVIILSCNLMTVLEQLAHILIFLAGSLRK